MTCDYANKVGKRDNVLKYNTIGNAHLYTYKIRRI